MPDQPAAVAGISRTLRTMADGSVRLQIDFEPRDRAAVMSLFGEPTTPVALARMPSGDEESPEQAGYGDAARALHASGFFRAPDVWHAAGTDQAFQDWLRNQKCAAHSRHCHGQVVPAHYRTVDAGAGVALKPPYSVIPLCDTHHRRQHSAGHDAVFAREEWSKQVVRHVSAWARETIKHALGFEHWNQVPPSILLGWAQRHEVDHYLPTEYRSA